MTVIDGCKTKTKKKPAQTPPTIVGNPTPPPQEPAPGNPDNPSEPGKPNPIPTPGQPTPTPTPTPTGSPNPIPTPAPVPLDRYGDPIIPTTPIVLVPHVILDTGVVRIVRNEILTAQICAESDVTAYYVPCDTGLNCWGWFKPAATCGYFICQRWGWR